LQVAFSQNCSLPILTNFNQTTQSQFNAIWIDFNSDIDHYEIEFGVKSFSRTFEPNITNITSNDFTFQNLLPGTTYEIYIRTVCDIDRKSDWNGPYFNSTNIDNNSPCALALDITDNNCPIRNTFNIEVSGFDNRVIGTDVNIENIALAIKHTWPPDLDIALTSPNGKSATLSSHNGNGIDDYGEPSDDCLINANFNDKACITVRDWTPPFQGSFNAEVELASAFDGEPANGIWQLSICDRAVGDVGQLTHVKLEFSTESCQAPQDFIIFDIEGTSATFNWQSFENCKSINLTYNEIGAPPEDVFIDIVDCISETFTVTGLQPGTLYELNVNTECEEGVLSNPLCALSFETRCSDSDYKTFFDDTALCVLNCDSICSISGVWNLDSSLSHGWFVQNGGLNNTFTGPSSDKNGNGNYLQTDPSLTCLSNTTALLNSECLDITNDNGCSISFYYHMFGNQVGSLHLEFSSDQLNWQSVWNLEGDQGDLWNFASVELRNDLQSGRLRFRAESLGTNNQGIIAVDHIKLYNSEVVDLSIYYQDLDNDGFGNPDSIQLICSQENLIGFSKNNLDCDDTNDLINPMAQEVSCNQIDENCNGPVDDAQTADIDITIINVEDETCKGSSNGEIEIGASSGVPPFSFSWSNGDFGPLATNLTSGVYTCTITGSDGCQTITAPIFVGFENILVYNVNDIVNSSCQGASDGEIEINVAGGTEPYIVNWPNGDVGFSTSNLKAGSYQATISGSNGCSLITDPIEVLGNQLLTTGVAIKNNIDCFGDSTGFIQLGILGGVTPYSILWSNGDTTAFITDLKSGKYSVTITDSVSCFSVIERIEIEEPPLLEVSLNRKRNLICNGDSNGQVDINVNGGTPPYSYFWSNGTFKQDLFDVGEGTYSVTITDFKACSSVLDNISLVEPDEFNIVLDSISSVSCSGSAEGFVGVSVNGGTAPYTYNWSTSDGVNGTDAFVDSLLAGQYFVTVVDIFGCKSLPGQFEVNNQNIPININMSQLDEIACHSDSTASLIAISSSSNLPLDFNWSAGFKQVKSTLSDTLTSLIQGSYNVTITDAEGCVGISDSIKINQPEEIDYVVVDISNNLCFGENNGSISVEANGGTGAFSFSWGNNDYGGTIENLTNGSYQLTITDDLDCQIVTEQINISSPEVISVDAIIVAANENDGGSISLNVIGGLQPYTYDWEQISLGSDSLVSNLDPGLYNVTVSDRNDCELDTFFTIDFVSGMNEQSSSDLFTFFPNPVKEIIYLKSNKDFGNLNVRILDIAGKTVRHFNLKNNQEIYINEMTSGIYFIECQYQDFYQISKIVVLH